jgi:hypothetical protein
MKHIHISKTEFETSFFDVSLSDFDVILRELPAMKELVYRRPRLKIVNDRVNPSFLSSAFRNPMRNAPPLIPSKG